MLTGYSPLLNSFESQNINLAEFGHLQHVQVAFEMLQKYDFLNAFTKYSTTINALATKAGVPEKFNFTVTLAFLSLIAERMHESNETSFEAFIAINQDLLNKGILAQWYSPHRLQSDLAKKQFLLPNLAA